MGVEVEKFKQGSKETNKIVNDSSNKHQKGLMTHSLRLPFDLGHFCMGEEIVLYFRLHVRLFGNT